jgi:hypothetical protein
MATDTESQCMMMATDTESQCMMMATDTESQCMMMATDTVTLPAWGHLSVQLYYQHSS